MFQAQLIYQHISTPEVCVIPVLEVVELAVLAPHRDQKSSLFVNSVIESLQNPTIY